MSPRHPIVVFILSIVLSSILTGCGNPYSPDPGATERANRWNLPERVLKYQRLANEARSSANQIVEAYVPKTSGQIDDLELQVADLLSGLPGVIEVTDSKVDAPSQRIIHLIDHPLPTRDEFLVCLRKMGDNGVTTTHCDSLYEEFLLQVELMQLEQMAVLRCLIKHHGLRQMFVEGLTQTNMNLYQEKIASLREERTDESNQQKNENGQRRLGLLEIGAAGQLLMLGEIQDLLPLDDADLIDQSTLEFHDVAISPRNPTHVHAKIFRKRTDKALDYQIKTALDHGVFGFIVGDAHDLTETVNRISGGKCEYIRITTKWSNEISPLYPDVWGR